MMHKQETSWFWRLLKESYEELTDYDPLRLSSSTAFFAMFAIIPIILLPLNLLGTIFSEEILKEQIFSTLQKMFGAEATEYLSTILTNIQNMQQGLMLTIGIIIFLVFVATTLFHVIHNSFNQILQVKVKSKTSLVFTLRKRVLFLIIILVGGLLFLATFTVEIALNFITDQFSSLSGLNRTLIQLLNLALSLGVFTVWLAIIYKYLPDIQIPWSPVWFGALLTAVLLLIGQFIIGKVILMGNLNTIYGASASMILILLFIFYCSFILYYGFCIMKKYTEMKNYELKTTKYSARYEIKEVNKK